ncbi:MAG: hypothetical protein R3B70_38265 [Polyangiaceae bacterium]
MHTSIIIARLLGPVMLTGSAALLLNRRSIQKIASAAVQNPALLYITGALSLTMGLAIVQFHNVWNGSWQIPITLWRAEPIARGLTRMFFPQRVAEMGERIVRRPGSLEAMAVISAILGSILTVEGMIRPL